MSTKVPVEQHKAIDEAIAAKKKRGKAVRADRLASRNSTKKKKKMEIENEVDEIYKLPGQEAPQIV